MTIPLELMPPLMFGGLIVIMLIGYPVAFSLATLGFLFGFLAIEQGFFNPQFMQAIPLPHIRQRAVERTAARGPVLHLHGRGAGEMRSRRGNARFDGAAVRPDPRRPRLLGHHRRLHSRRHHRHRRGAGHRHGADLDAGDDPLRLQHALHHRRACGVRHHHAAGAAIAGADRARRPARQVGRRHVSRRLGTLDLPDRAVRAATPSRSASSSPTTFRRCRRKRAR